MSPASQTARAPRRAPSGPSGEPVRPAPGRPARPRSAPSSAQRRRRAERYALRRRDLTLDAVAGFIAAIVLISLTAGLGVLALLVFPLAGALLLSGVLERRARRRGDRAG